MAEAGSSEKKHPTLIQRVETMSSVIELLFETLTDLSEGEFKRFWEVLSEIDFHKGYTDIPWMLLETTEMQDTVFFMVLNYGQLSVEKTKKILQKINRTDLMQRLHSSSGPKKKRTVDENLSALIHKVATMRTVNELLLETLDDLSSKEQKKFKWLLQFKFLQWGLSQISLRRLNMADSADQLVDVMVQIWGQQSVEVIKEVLMDMNRTDLVQRLPETSSGPKETHSVDEHWPGLFQIHLGTLGFLKAPGEKLGVQSVSLGSDLQPSTSNLLDKRRPLCPLSYSCHYVETMASVIELLLETLVDLCDKELETFIDVLSEIPVNRLFTNIALMLLETTDMQDIVFLMVLTYGQHSVEKIKEVLEKMNRTDLVQRLSDSSSGPKKKHSDEHRSALIQKVATMSAVEQLLLETLNDLSNDDLEKFKEFLELIISQKDLQEISLLLRLTSNRVETVDLMVQMYGQYSVDLTREVVKKMNRTDLMQRLSQPSSELKGPSGSLELEVYGSINKDSSDWTKLEPEVNTKDADEAPSYSLQSEAGHFECSVSGLRWICKGKVSFTYQFCSLEEHMERIESLQYMPAGPLMDITVIAGKLDEVYLPHWICIDDNPTILDKFAVLHIDDCGDAVEKVSEVTSSHVKLCEPVFSLKMVILKLKYFLEFPVEVNCNVLIYKTNTAFLTLHVFLIPRDPGLQQELDKRELSYGYRVIRKPYPEKSLRMKDRFILTTDLKSAEICPETLMLRYESTDPNFFEVFIDDPDTNFNLELKKENERQSVWTCTIRKDEYQSTTQIQGEDFVNKHRAELIDRVSNIAPIMDELLAKEVLSQGTYDDILALPTTRDKMRKLYSGPLHSAGHDGKEVFYKLLEEHEKYLIDELKNKR